MFGKPKFNNGQAIAQRPKASDEARIEGGGLVQVVVTNTTPMAFFLFLNDRIVPQEDVESLSLYVAANDPAHAGPVVRATLARYVTSVTGERSVQRMELFPCTLELVALGRRISVTCTNADSLEGLWISLGLKADGTGYELNRLESFTVLLSADLLDARLVWEDGIAEVLLPESL